MCFTIESETCLLLKWRYRRKDVYKNSFYGYSRKTIELNEKMRYDCDAKEIYERIQNMNVVDFLLSKGW